MIAESSATFLWGFFCGQLVLLASVVLLGKALMFGRACKPTDDVKLRRQCPEVRGVEEEKAIVNVLMGRIFETVMLERLLRKWTKRLNQELANLPELRPWGRVQLTAIDLASEPPRVQSMEQQPDGTLRILLALPPGYSLTLNGTVCPYKVLSLPFECDIALQCVTVGLELAVLESEFALTVLANPQLDFGMRCRWGHRVQVCDDTRYIEGLVRSYLRRLLCEPVRIKIRPI